MRFGVIAATGVFVAGLVGTAYGETGKRDGLHQIAPSHSSAQGSIDVGELRRAIERVEDLSLPCRGSGSAAKSGRRSQWVRSAGQPFDPCALPPKVQERRYAHARDKLNKKWMPALIKASEQGDPVAEVILRICGTAPLLDRTNVAADCSIQEEKRRFAKYRLERIGFKPALYAFSNPLDLHEINRGDCGGEKRCLIEATIEDYRRMIEIMKTGYLGFDTYTNRCPIGSNIDDLDLLAEECWFHRCLARSAVPGSLGSYTKNLSLTSKEFMGGTDPIWPVCTSRNDWSPLRDPSFPSRLVTEARRNLHQMEENIRGDLLRDPRWGAFLMMRHGARQYEPRTFRDIESLLVTATGWRLDGMAYTLPLAGNTGKRNKHVPGFVHERANSPVSAMVFVTERLNENDYRPVVSSKLFDYTQASRDGYVASVHVVTGDHFSIKFRANRPCGETIDIYRFEMLQGNWYVSSHDRSSSACGDPDARITTGYSVDFLTGRVLLDERRNGKLTSRRRVTQHFQPLPLTEFSAFHARYDISE